MEIFANPAALVGAGSCIAVAGWIMGRWHGTAMEPLAEPDQADLLHVPGEASVDAGIATPTAHKAQTDTADKAIGLDELHDEITALRRRERVLASLRSDGFVLENIIPGARHRSTIAISAAPSTVAQPSLGASSLTRV